MTFKIENKVTIIDFDNPCFIGYEPNQELFENYLESEEYQFMVNNGGFRLIHEYLDKNNDIIEHQVGIIGELHFEDNRLVTDSMYLNEIPDCIGNFRLICFGEAHDHKQEIDKIYIRGLNNLDIKAGFKSNY